ncbi:hypothetical protein VEE05_16910 [Escherichia coli]|nr:hypothetical protein VEE05_16910 [Escherichia coli]
MNETITNKTNTKTTLISSPMPSDSISAAFDKARGIKYCPELNSDAACTPRMDRYPPHKILLTIFFFIKKIATLVSVYSIVNIKTQSVLPE